MTSPAEDELERLSLAVIEPCEPDCDEVRHALHEGSWEAHLKIEAALEQLNQPEGSKPPAQEGTE